MTSRKALGIIIINWKPVKKKNNYNNALISNHPFYHVWITDKVTVDLIHFSSPTQDGQPQNPSKGCTTYLSRYELPNLSVCLYNVRCLLFRPCCRLYSTTMFKQQTRSWQEMDLNVPEWSQPLVEAIAAPVASAAPVPRARRTVRSACSELKRPSRSQ